MRRFVSSCVAAAVAGVLVPAGLTAQDMPWNRYTLAGLGGLYVQIEADDVCQGAGVTTTAFEASTSLKLIEGEVGVLTQMEMLENPAHPELHVAFECAAGSGGAMAFSVALRVVQASQMLRDTQITLPETVTWYTGKLGVTAAGGVPEALEAALDETLDGLIEAWAAANTEEEGSR